MVVNPYKDEQINKDEFVRLFSKDVLLEELKWHRDHNDRMIEVLEGEGWELQLENRLPIKLKQNDRILIPAKSYHRVKRGSSDLKLKIQEFKNGNR